MMKRFLTSIFLLFLLLFTVQKAYATIVFTISNATVNSDDSVDVDASITGLISSSCSSGGCYLQAQLKILDESKGYFGYTYNNSGEFVDYFSSPSSTDEIKSKLFDFIPASGAWSGKLKAKSNFIDNNYLGPGEYTLRFRRFSGNSTSPTSSDSNVLTVSLLLAAPTPTSAPTSTPYPTSIPTNTPIPTATKTPTPLPTIRASIIPSPTPSKIIVSSVSAASISAGSDVLGLSAQKNPKVTNEPILVKGESFSVLPPPIFFILSGLGIITGACGILLFRQWRQQKEEEI